MTKDYAKKRPRGRFTANNTYPDILLPPWAWMSAGMLLGIMLSGMMYWKLHPLKEKEEPVKIDFQDTNANNASDNANAANGEKSTHVSRFDFYTVLPKMTDSPESIPQDTLAKDETRPAVTEKPAGTPPSSAQPGYIIQAGSFRQLPQAEELKAQLALAGFEASVQTIKITDEDTRYRVYVGPFENKDKASSRQQQLEQAHKLNSLIVKMRV